MSSTRTSEGPIQVVAYSGYQAEQEPRALIVEGRRLEVTCIEDRWYDPAGSYFRVRTSDGTTSLLRYDFEALDWFRVSAPGSATKDPLRA